MIIEITDKWIPTPKNINELPKPLRNYIHDLETSDRRTADLVQENAALKFLLELMTVAMTDIAYYVPERMGHVNAQMDEHYPEDAPIEKPVLKILRGGKDAGNDTGKEREDS